MKKCDQNIEEIFLLIQKMLSLADEGDNDREDTGCGVMYGMLRDSAYKIQQLAEKEKQAHLEKEMWKKAARYK
ncbi:MAG: hypothetical protein GY714_11310 [Desulfobacterales bacterium]|nr:hypothetical protein [Desulfobacterales bacterium]MCP4159799.1 hypothetical protein [Deltaproteobacteria bacterium]